MIHIGRYDELSPGKGYESMKKHFEKEKYAGQGEIVYYLRHGKDDMASMSIPKDVFTGESIKEEKLRMNDGTYMWWSTLAYYVEKYNLRLPKEFENHILNN